MNIKFYLEQRLSLDGYDGLFTDGCSCLVSNIAPCGESPLDCEPGVLIDPPPDGSDFFIGPKKGGA